MISAPTLGGQPNILLLHTRLLYRFARFSFSTIHLRRINMEYTLRQGKRSTINRFLARTKRPV